MSTSPFKRKFYRVLDNCKQKGLPVHPQWQLANYAEFLKFAIATAQLSQNSTVTENELGTMRIVMPNKTLGFVPNNVTIVQSAVHFEDMPLAALNNMRQSEEREEEKEREKNRAIGLVVCNRRLKNPLNRADYHEDLDAPLERTYRRRGFTCRIIHPTELKIIMSQLKRMMDYHEFRKLPAAHHSVEWLSESADKGLALSLDNTYGSDHIKRLQRVFVEGTRKRCRDVAKQQNEEEDRKMQRRWPGSSFWRCTIQTREQRQMNVSRADAYNRQMLFASYTSPDAAVIEKIQTEAQLEKCRNPFCGNVEFADGLCFICSQHAFVSVPRSALVMENLALFIDDVIQQTTNP